MGIRSSMVYCVGLTGTVASGKSTVAELFSGLGITIINADTLARQLTAKNQPAYHKIIAHFGAKILDEEGELNRKRLRDIIFSNTEGRNWLEQLLHPLIRQRIKEQVSLCTSAYCMVEIPLLKDKKDYPYLNRILLVNAPIDMQIARLMQRDHCSKEHALAILSAQPHINQYLKNADDVLINDSGFKELKEAVSNLHLKYLKKY